MYSTGFLNSLQKCVLQKSFADFKSMHASKIKINAALEIN